MRFLATLVMALFLPSPAGALAAGEVTGIGDSLTVEASGPAVVLHFDQLGESETLDLGQVARLQDLLGEARIRMDRLQPMEVTFVGGLNGLYVGAFHGDNGRVHGPYVVLSKYLPDHRNAVVYLDAGALAELDTALDEAQEVAALVR